MPRRDRWARDVPEEITAKLDALGWDADIRGTGERFYAGTARPRC